MKLHFHELHIHSKTLAYGMIHVPNILMTKQKFLWLRPVFLLMFYMYSIWFLISYFHNIQIWIFTLVDAGHDGAKHAPNFASNSAQLVTMEPIVVPAIPVDEIKEATKNFSNETYVGESSYARIYCGTLRNGHKSAIKRLDATKQPDGVFLAQVCWSLLLTCLSCWYYRFAYRRIYRYPWCQDCNTKI